MRWKEWHIWGATSLFPLHLSRLEWHPIIPSDKYKSNFLFDYDTDMDPI